VRKLLLFSLVLVLLVASSVLAETRVVNVNVKSVTGIAVPVRITMSHLRDLVGEDFDANWDSIRVYDSQNNELPYQIDDVDLNGKLSAKDVLAFLTIGNAKIKVSDDLSIEPPTYANSFVVKSINGEETISTNDGKFVATVDDHGIVHVKKFDVVEGTVLDEIGIARVSGFPESTYYVNKEIGKHVEKVSYDFRVAKMKVLDGNNPVAVTVVADLVSKNFVGLEQHNIISIYKTGDILVNTKFVFKTYEDMMKLQIMVTRPLTEVAEDAIHILPIFRRLTWADQLGVTPLDYWLEKNAIVYVDKEPYTAFSATDSMKPLWWGATYIFASEERWRTNYSPKLKMGVGEILPEKEIVPVDYWKWICGNTWVYESREFRDGVFKWIPGEFDVYAATKGCVPKGQLPNRYKAGDVVVFNRVYSIYNSSSEYNAVRYLEGRTKEFRSVKITK